MLYFEKMTAKILRYSVSRLCLQAKRITRKATASCMGETNIDRLLFVPSAPHSFSMKGGTAEIGKNPGAYRKTNRNGDSNHTRHERPTMAKA